MHSPALTVRRAALIAAVVAILVYLPALGNRFALDDGAIVERNASAHTMAAGLHAFAHPYGPPEEGAGLWRPAVILSFAIEWQLSGGSPAVMHAMNILYHALATALVVLVIAPYLTTLGALAGGLVFAIHPVHVEAVANLVGRAELFVAIGLMAAVLFSREATRRRADARSALGFEALALFALLVALLSKEHAVIAVALLWLDDRALARGNRPPWRLLGAIAVMTVAWLVARRAVEGGLSFDAVAPTFFHLGTAGRLFTMMPAVLVLVRLLVWPFDLSPDYHPQVIDRLEHLTPAGVLGAIVLLALVVLALLLWRAHRRESLGLLIIGLAWLPTSNLFFPSGIVLAERTLYLATVGLVLLAGAGIEVLFRRLHAQRAGVLVSLAAIPLVWTTMTRIPAWRSTRDLVVTALLAHPESYKVHQSAARVLWRLGLHEQGLAEYHVAEELYPLDHYLLAEMASGDLEMGRLRDARKVLLKAEPLDPGYVLTQQLLAQLYLRIDSPLTALAHARRAVAAGPTKAEPARMLAASFVSLHQPDSALAVWPAFLARGGDRFNRWLLGAATWAAVGKPDSARLGLDSAAAALPPDTIAQRRLRETRMEVRRLSSGRP